MSNQEEIRHPQRYNTGGKHNIECYKAIEYILERLENVPPRYYGHISNVIKYVWRCNFKNGYEDLDKASAYLDFMFEDNAELLECECERECECACDPSYPQHEEKEIPIEDFLDLMFWRLTNE